jgi:hypothetical protein
MADYGAEQTFMRRLPNDLKWVDCRRAIAGRAAQREGAIIGHSAASRGFSIAVGPVPSRHRVAN